MSPTPEDVHEIQAGVFKAIGHPTRLHIVKILKDGERSVTEIVGAVGGEQSNVSRHLALLKQAGVLSCRKAGLKVFYRLASTDLLGNMRCVLRCLPKTADTECLSAGASQRSSAQSPPPSAG